MPFDSSGVFTNVSGATTAAANNTIQSGTWNNIHTDYGTALNTLSSILLNQKSIYRNIVYGNGGFEVWQRGAGDGASISVGASTTAYTADRWYLLTGANQAHTVSAQTGLSANSYRSARIQRNAGQTGTGVVRFGYPLDTEEVTFIKNKKVTLSFLAQAGGNWSPASGTLSYAVYAGTASPAKRTTGFTGETTLLSGTVNLTAGGALQTVVSIGATTAGNIGQAEVHFFWTPSGTAGAADYVQIDNVSLQAQETSDWISYNYDTVPFIVSLENCMRHYQKTFDYNVAPVTNGGDYTNAIAFIAPGAVQGGAMWQLTVPMRVNTPTYTTFNPGAANANWRDASGSVDLALTTSYATSKRAFFYAAAAAAAGRLCFVHAQADAGI